MFQKFSFLAIMLIASCNQDMFGSEFNENDSSNNAVTTITGIYSAELVEIETNSLEFPLGGYASTTTEPFWLNAIGQGKAWLSFGAITRPAMHVDLDSNEDEEFEASIHVVAPGSTTSEIYNGSVPMLLVAESISLGSECNNADPSAEIVPLAVNLTFLTETTFVGNRYSDSCGNFFDTCFVATCLFPSQIVLNLSGQIFNGGVTLDISYNNFGVTAYTMHAIFIDAGPKKAPTLNCDDLIGFTQVTGCIPVEFYEK